MFTALTAAFEVPADHYILSETQETPTTATPHLTEITHGLRGARARPTHTRTIHKTPQEPSTTHSAALPPNHTVLAAALNKTLFFSFLLRSLLAFINIQTGDPLRPRVLPHEVRFIGFLFRGSRNSRALGIVAWRGEGLGWGGCH